jgi:hypothetical protein
MAPPYRPLFDARDPGHKTVAEWRAAGNSGWFANAVISCLAHGESRILLNAGNILILRFDGIGPIAVEEVP